MSPPEPLPPLIVIVGATATGKTRLSLALAARLPGAHIVCADSRQVYRGMDIGTAKVGRRERDRVPHHGLDLVDPDEPFTVADYQRHAGSALAAIAAGGGRALLVGGTGLYLRAVARGLPLESTGHDPLLREELQRRLAREGLAALVAELEAQDAEGAVRIDRRNPRRVVRALERVQVTGRATPPPPRGYAGRLLWLGLEAEPAQHQAAIIERARRHFEEGLLDEAAALRARYPETLPAFSAMGYREAFDVLAGRSDVETAIATAARRTWAYARRQRTWFRSEPDIEWLAAGEGAEPMAWAAVERFLAGHAG